MFTYQWRYQKDVIKVVLMSSLLFLNYFRSSPSFPIIDFERVNICWENYLIFYSFDICFTVSTGARQELTRSNAGNSAIFSYFTHSVRCNLCKPLITQIIHSRNTGKFINVTTNFWGTKIKQEIALNPLLRIISHFKKP